MKHSWDFRRFGVALGLLWSMVGPMDLWAQGLPQGEVLIHGQAGFERDGTTLTIRQESDAAIINYDSFSIGRDHTVQFIQPDVSASALNRVTGSGRSEIAGALLANGQVYLINPNGILFTESARVDVGGLVASSMQISDQDFLSGRMYFDGVGADVINEGVITAGFAYLVGRHVENRGAINAAQVAIAAGESSVLIDQAAGGRIELVIDGESEGASSDTREYKPGEKAEPDQEELILEETSAAAVSISAGASSISGNVDDPVIVELGATQPALPSIINRGIINASGEQGGHILIHGSRIAQMGELRADGTSGDGGQIELMAADAVILGNDSITTANAGSEGDGGSIIIVGENTARVVNGAGIEARGGRESGDGGFVETSGYQRFQLGAMPDVSAPAGQGGMWLIDPTDITIDVGTGLGIPGSPVTDNTLHADDITDFLENIGSLIITTVPDIGDVGNIDWLVGADVAWSSVNSLELIADNNIAFGGTILADQGDISFSSQSDIFINNSLSTGGNVTLEAQSGSLSGAGRVTATTLTADAATGVDLNTTVTTLDASVSGVGNILRLARTSR